MKKKKMVIEREKRMAWKPTTSTHYRNSNTFCDCPTVLHVVYCSTRAINRIHYREFLSGTVRGLTRVKKRVSQRTRVPKNTNVTWEIARRAAGPIGWETVHDYRVLMFSDIVRGEPLKSDYPTDGNARGICINAFRAPAVLFRTGNAPVPITPWRPRSFRPSLSRRRKKKTKNRTKNSSARAHVVFQPTRANRLFGHVLRARFSSVPSCTADRFFITNIRTFVCIYSAGSVRVRKRVYDDRDRARACVNTLTHRYGSLTGRPPNVI